MFYNNNVFNKRTIKRLNGTYINSFVYNNSMIIGKRIKDKKAVKINLNNLIISRLLIQANAGGGKSWLLRKILEESHGKIQQIIIDIEGEFSTLRDEYDYLLCGRGGDIPVNIKTADLLPRKILELNVSTIIDISELKKHERILFVKRFLDSLMESPRKLWHPCIVVIDEAHQFCPQASKSESTSSVIDLMTRGRKRGFCGILATQRISKLHKDACAEANNRLIGRTGLDVDRKRASEELGFTSKEDERNLRFLEPGEFHAFGSSISREIIKMKVGDVKTTHPEAGKNLIKTSPTPDNIKKILKDVIDLPKEAEEEIKTKQGMQKKIQELKFKLRTSESSQKVQEKIQEKIINVTDEKALQRAKDEGFKEAERFYKSYIIPIEQNTNALKNSILKLITNANGLLESKAFAMVGDIKASSPSKVKIKSNLKNQVKSLKNITPINQTLSRNNSINFPKSYSSELQPSGEKISGGAMKMLKATAMFHPKPITRARMGAISGLSFKSGTFGTYLAVLKRNGLIISLGPNFNITEEGLNIVGDFEPMPMDSESIINLWMNIVKGGASRMLSVLANNYPNEITREDLGMQAEISSTSGTFGTYLATLKRNGLIKVKGGQISVSSELFE